LTGAKSGDFHARFAHVGHALREVFIYDGGAQKTLTIYWASPNRLSFLLCLKAHAVISTLASRMWDMRCAKFLFTMGARKKLSQSIGLRPID